MIDIKSYLMGVFDGEGCVSAYRQRGNVALTISVEMASEPITSLFREVWGGNLHVRPKPTAGGLVMHSWYIGARAAIPFLGYACENSLAKRRQAAIALELAENMAKYSAGRRRLLAEGRYISDVDVARRERLVLEMRSLNGARNRFVEGLTRSTT